MNTKHALIFHAVGLSHHLFTGVYSNMKLDFTNITNERVLDIGRFNFRYFTTWNLIMQTIYFSFALLNDLFVIYGRHFSPRLYRNFASIRGYMFTTFVFPCTMVVFSLFWTLFYINRDFVLPEAADKVLPSWVNHSIHTNILYLIIGELLIPNMKIPSPRKSMIGITLLTIAYSSCYFGTYFQTGRWLYGVFDILSWPQRIGFLFLNYIITLVFYRTGVMVQNLVAGFISIKNKTQYEKILTAGARKVL